MKRYQDTEQPPQGVKRIKESSRQNCQYGVNCYRRSPSHFKEFKHEELEALFLDTVAKGSQLTSAACDRRFPDSTVVQAQLEILQRAEVSSIILREKGSVSCKLNSAAPLIQPVNPTTGDSHNLLNEAGGACDNNTLPTSMLNTSSEPSDDHSNSKMEKVRPSTFLFTRIPGEGKTSGSIAFSELFDDSLGEVDKLCHFNFMVEAEWYLDQIQNASVDGRETTIVYGVESSELEECSRAFPWLTVHHVKSPFPFGHHHTKMSLIQYIDGSMRFLVYTANLIESDWENRTQGLWMSPKCPKVDSGETSNSSVTGSLFKAHLIEYLNTYPAKCKLSSWINSVRKIDTSEIKVIFIGSAPVTSQSSQNGFQWGLKKVDAMLNRFQTYAKLDPSWPLLIQCSSIGSLGQSDEWLRGEFGRLLGKRAWGPSTPIKVVYPSDRNVRNSVDGIYGGSCLPYSRATHSKQQWLKKHLHLWKSDLAGRTMIMPHIKTYARISPDGTKLAWFLLTSANLSKAAWGKLNKNQDRLTVMSWEAGILFIPELLGHTDGFPVSTSKVPKSGELMLPFDIPLVRYKDDDGPWQMETLREAQ